MAKKTKKLVLYLVGADCCDPAQEKEFNDWYDNTHIPEVFRDHPGFVSAQRYEIVDAKAGYPKFLAVYEMADEAAYNNFVEFVKKARASKTAWFTPGPKFNVVWSAAYKPI